MTDERWLPSWLIPTDRQLRALTSLCGGVLLYPTLVGLAFAVPDIDILEYAYLGVACASAVGLAVGALRKGPLGSPRTGITENLHATSLLLSGFFVALTVTPVGRSLLEGEVTIPDLGFFLFAILVSVVLAVPVFAGVEAGRALVDSRYDGWWSNDQPAYDAGRRYNGQWSNSQRTSAPERQYDQRWQNDPRVADAGRRYEGGWQNGQRASAPERQYEGGWQNGQRASDAERRYDP